MRPFSGVSRALSCPWLHELPSGEGRASPLPTTLPPRSDGGHCPCRPLKTGSREPERGRGEENRLGECEETSAFSTTPTPATIPSNPPRTRPQLSVSHQHRLYLCSPILLSLMRKGSAQAVWFRTLSENTDEGHSDLKLFFCTNNIRRTPACLTPESITLQCPPGWLLPFTLEVRAVEITRPT